jgi:hypothetical protein
MNEKIKTEGEKSDSRSMSHLCFTVGTILAITATASAALHQGNPTAYACASLIFVNLGALLRP